ncbi:MAG: hypothetical protein ACI9WU_003049 [Myxococcota bacterium]|jgi:hypothetical protein
MQGGEGGAGETLLHYISSCRRGVPGEGCTPPPSLSMAPPRTRIPGTHPFIVPICFQPITQKGAMPPPGWVVYCGAEDASLNFELRTMGC